MGTDESRVVAGETTEMSRPYPQQQQQSIVGKSNAKAEALRREIQYIERVIDSKRALINQYYYGGQEREALNVTEEVKRMGIDRDNKRTALQRLEKAQGLHAKVRDIAETQDIVKDLTNETKRLATVLDIDDIGETNMDARVVDTELDEMLNRMGLNAEDRQEEEQSNRELMLSLLTPPSQNVNHRTTMQQQHQPIVMMNTLSNSNAMPSQRPHQQQQVPQRPPNNTNNNNNGSPHRSLADHMFI